jgi:hypothetical protein
MVHAFLKGRDGLSLIANYINRSAGLSKRREKMAFVFFSVMYDLCRRPNPG